MLLECFVLFIKVVTPEGLNFPDEYGFLRSQEIILFVIASLQLFVMSMGVVYRAQLAQNYSYKTLWALAAFVLSTVMFAMSIKNVRITRQLIIFIFSAVQACSAVVIYWTCYKLKRVLHDF